MAQCHLLFSCNGRTSHDLHIYVLNPTSLAKKDAITLLECDCTIFNLGIVLICETWFTSIHSDDNVSIPGFQLYRKDRNNRRGGGVCAFVRQSYASSLCDIPVGHIADSHLVEIIWIKLNFDCQEFFVGCCYVPPNPIYNFACLSEVISYQIDFIFNHSKNSCILLTGDFNRINTDFMECDLGLTQLVKDPTHCGNILDKAFVNRPDLFDVTVVKSLIKTKHSALLISNNVNKTSAPVDSRKRKKVILYDKRQENIDKLRFLLYNFNWTFLYHNNDLQCKYDLFLIHLKRIIDDAIPQKMVTLGPRDPSFMTPLVKDLLNKRRKLLRKNKVDQANALAIRINGIITNQRSQSLNRLTHASTKQLWDAVKPKSGKLFASTASCLSDVNLANASFAEVSYDKNSNFNYNDSLLEFNILAGTDNARPGFTSTLSPYVVEYLLRKVKSTAPGLDSVPYWVFKTCSFELSEVICHLFSASLYDGVLPAQWKKAIVTPIPKIPKPVLITDYRPISVTSLLSRILEKFVVKNFIQPVFPSLYLQDQFGFRPTGSTTCALIYTVHHVTKMLESNSYVRCLLIDFSKAFDLVDHCILLKKLSKLPLPLNIYKWIVSFLSCRSQVLSFNGVVSEECNINRRLGRGRGWGRSYSVLCSAT